MSQGYLVLWQWYNTSLLACCRHTQLRHRTILVLWLGFTRIESYYSCTKLRHRTILVLWLGFISIESKFIGDQLLGHCLTEFSTEYYPNTIYVALTLKFLKSYHLEVARPVSSHYTVCPRSIHRVPASHCPQRKPFPLDSVVILDLASFHDLYTWVPASHCPQRKPFPLDSSWVILDL